MLKNIIQLIYKIIPSIQNSLLPKSQSIYVELFHILPKKIPNYDTKTLPNTFLICEALGRSSERVTQAVKMTIDKMFSDI